MRYFLTWLGVRHEEDGREGGEGRGPGGERGDRGLGKVRVSCGREDGEGAVEGGGRARELEGGLLGSRHRGGGRSRELGGGGSGGGPWLLPGRRVRAQAVPRRLGDDGDGVAVVSEADGDIVGGRGDSLHRLPHGGLHTAGRAVPARARAARARLPRQLQAGGGVRPVLCQALLRLCRVVQISPQHVDLVFVVRVCNAMFTASKRTPDNILPGMWGPEGELGGEGEHGWER